MKEYLLEILRCPETGGKLQIRNAKIHNNEIYEGELVNSSGRVYPVIKGIPRFVDSDAYVSNFSMEWTIHRKTQLDTETCAESFESFKERVGFNQNELQGKMVLDAGVGMGRYSDVVLKMGAKAVGIDLSFAIESAQSNLSNNPNFNCIQADIFNPPFEKECFDYIFSIGVLHHTPDCRKAFLSLVPYLKKGGEIAIWVYAWRGFQSIRSNFWRFFTTKIPHKTLYWIIKTFLPIWDFGLKIPVIHKAFWIIPTSYHPDKEWRILDTFDWYSPKYQSKHRWEEVEKWFEEAGLKEIRRMNFPISVRGKKC